MSRYDLSTAAYGNLMSQSPLKSEVCSGSQINLVTSSFVLVLRKAFADVNVA